MWTHHVYFPVRDDHEHKRGQERDESEVLSNIFRHVSPTRIRTYEAPAGGKYKRQRTHADKGPERNAYAVAPASRIIATEYHVANACVQQNQTHIRNDVKRDPNKLVADPCVPNVTFTLGRDRPQIYR